MDNKKISVQRETKYELLRIICIFLIISHHWGIHGGAINSEIAVNKWISMFLTGGGQIAVSIFFLLSGFFYCNAEFSIRKTIKLLFPVWFYCDFIAIIYFLQHQIGLKWLLMQFFPVINRTYNFVTWYLLVFFLAPYLKKLILSLTYDELNKLIYLGFFWLIFIPTITGKNYLDIIYPVFLYLVGAQIHNRKKAINKKTIYMLMIVPYICLFIILAFWSLLGYDIIELYKHFISTESFFVFISSINVFSLFVTLKMKYNKWINRIARCVWGIFLLHDNGIIRNLLWDNFFKVKDNCNGKVVILICNFFNSVLGTFTVCLCIEYIRIAITDKIELKMRNK